MKRIAIITYSRAYNYGSALQTYALNRYLRELGNEVKTIDYTTNDQQRLYSIFEPINGFKSMLRNLQSIRYYNSLQTHKQRFDDFLMRNVPMTNKISNSDELFRLNDQFDYFICGSDQIWNVQCDDFDSNYMLSFVKDKNKCIAYAPSLGAGSKDKKTIESIKTYINQYKAISSREQSSVKIISKATGYKVENVLDPVFLLDANQWTELLTYSPLYKEYILGYFIGDVVGMRDFASQLSNKSGLPVVVVWKSIRDVKYRFKAFYESGPLEFVSLVKGAKYIVTNSFHAVSFSLIFEKSFWAFLQPGSNDERLKSILGTVNLTNRIVDVESCSKVNMFAKIEYKSNNREPLNNMIESSRKFLNNNI